MVRSGSRPENIRASYKTQAPDCQHPQAGHEMYSALGDRAYATSPVLPAAAQKGVQPEKEASEATQ